MSHMSPETYLVWSFTSCLLLVFLLYHLWSFDRFKCLKWDSGAYSGAFKRIMTYSYLLSIPLIAAYSVGNAVIKYQVGFIEVPGLGIRPTPFTLWESSAQRWIFPLNLCFSVGWSLEMVTHLEELCFWLYLVNSSAANQIWFKTLYFKAWVVGSCVAVVYMPLITILTRQDPIKNEAYTFLAGSLGSLSLTLWFLPILYVFPRFMRNLRSEGVDAGTIIRLTKFGELNRIRVLFRFLFCVPLLVLGIDGCQPHNHPINENLFWTDILAVLPSFGVAVSSGITLVIFFPRSIEGEILAKETQRERKRSRKGRSTSGNLTGYRGSHDTNRMTYVSETYSYSRANSVTGHNDRVYAGSRQDTYHLNTSLSKTNFRSTSYDIPFTDEYTLHDYDLKSMDKSCDEEERDVAAPLPPIRPNRRRGPDVELGGVDTLTEINLSVHDFRMSSVNPLVHGFTSPIDLVYGQERRARATPRNPFKK